MGADDTAREVLSKVGVVQSVLQAAADEVRAEGAVPHVDHLVEDVMPYEVSSEFVGLRATDDGIFEVYYRDRGETSVLLRTAEAEDARLRFDDEAAAERAAARLRGAAGAAPPRTRRAPAAV